jgi:hypothetical protein
MARKISEFTEAILAVVAEVSKAKDKANEADPIPPMVERMSMSQGRKEFDKMSEFQRQMFLDNNGQDKLLEMARGRSGFDA